MNPHGAAGLAHRHADAATLAESLQASRRDTLATFDCYAAGLADQGLSVPYHGDVNPPLWELGHIGWFQEYWLARNPERRHGHRADPAKPRGPALRGDADSLYDSGRVAHASRWSLPLPNVQQTRADLDQQLRRSLALLADTESTDAALYFFRLALFHEDMHHEAAIYTAQALGLAIDDARWQAPLLPDACHELVFEPGRFELGSDAAGFAFDNELGRHTVELPATRIDSRVLRWADYLPFIDSSASTVVPRHLRRSASGWQRCHFGRWVPLDPRLPACHLSHVEAQAWCAWAGRRLPTEAEWERAATEQPEAFDWGAVWEWTASPFVPYPGFVAHPYGDYSAPWFGSRQVLRGASFATQARMHHARYRNYFTPERSDIMAGFRTCAV